MLLGIHTFLNVGRANFDVCVINGLNCSRSVNNG